MAAPLLYYITDRKQLGGTAAEQRARLLERVAAAAAAGVDHVQLRERDLTARELEALASAVAERLAGSRTRLLINHRLDVALAVGAAGVHLRSDDIAVADARAVAERVARPGMLVAVSCHTAEEVTRAAGAGADFAVFGPVFEKHGSRPGGVEALRSAVQAAGSMPVLALGGVARENAGECLAAGAAGIAGIRLFQQGDLGETVAALRGR